MPGRIVKQPNGMYARFSTICDHFTDYDLERDMAVALMGDEARVVAAESEPERFAVALKTIEMMYGPQEAAKWREDLSKPLCQ